jgi:tetratricopeptide (TPR) repeat protein
MKKITYILLFVTTIINGQELETKFSESLCECFNENKEKSKTDLDFNILETCMSSSFKKNEKEFNELLLRDIDTTSLNVSDLGKYGYQLGQKMFSDIQVRLINDCDSYNDYASLLISEMLKNIGKDSSQKKIDSISILIDNNPKNIKLIWERGAHKIGIGKLKSAQLDLNTCLEVDYTYAPALFFLACSYDLEGNPKKAIEIFEKILDQNKDFGSLGDFTKIYFAVLKRKSREKN